jgi:predicted methyltransferase
MQQSRNIARRLAVVVLILFVGVTALGGQNQSRPDQERQREQWQRVSEIITAMDVKPGASVADVGAGDGFFTTRLASAVGPAGRVFAVDIDDGQLDRLRRRLSGDVYRNVTVTKGTVTDPHLPAGTLDAALIVNAYHEMAEHQAMLQAIRAALKPTGRLVIVEPISEQKRTAARDEQTREHEIAPEFALQDARAAGFRIIGLEDPFTTRGRTLEWMLTVTPTTASATTAAAQEPATPAEDWCSPTLRISAEEFEKLARSRGVTLIDVRNEAMFAEGHIPDAVLIPLDDLEGAAERLRGMKRPFVTYCS